MAARTGRARHSPVAVGRTAAAALVAGPVAGNRPVAVVDRAVAAGTAADQGSQGTVAVVGRRSRAAADRTAVVVVAAVAAVDRRTVAAAGPIEGADRQEVRTGSSSRAFLHRVPFRCERSNHIRAFLVAPTVEFESAYVPSSTTPRRIARTARCAAAPSASSRPSTLSIWSSRSMTWRHQRTKSPAERS